MLTALHQTVGIGRLSQRERGVDHRGAAARIQRGPDFCPQVGGDGGFLRRGAWAHGGTGDRQPLHHHWQEVELRRLRSLQEGDHHQPAVHGQGADVAGHIGRADHVEDGVDATALGQGLHLGGEILRAVVDCRVGAQLQAGGAFVFRTGGGEDAGAEFPGKLDRGDADAAGAAVDECGLALGQAADLDRLAQTVKNVSGSAPARIAS